MKQLKIQDKLTRILNMQIFLLYDLLRKETKQIPAARARQKNLKRLTFLDTFCCSSIETTIFCEK